MKFGVDAHVVATKDLGVVDADTEEEAIEKAYKLDSAIGILCDKRTCGLFDAEILEIIAFPEEDLDIP